MGMLEDCIEAVQALEHVQIRFFLETSNHTFLQPRFFGTRFYCKISIPLPSHLFVRLPQTLMDGNMIRIVPVLFNIGIDHRALFAQVLSLSLFSGLQVEFDLNLQNFRKLKAYITQSLPYLPDNINGMMRLLERAFHVRKAKNVEILSLTEQICRTAFGIRVTGCKSAKDRTSMGFTLEQGRILIKQHKVKKHDLQEILNQLRRNGTSIENAFGNTGIRAYAFSYIQLLAFPEFYRAQPGTYSESET